MKTDKIFVKFSFFHFLHVVPLCMFAHYFCLSLKKHLTVCRYAFRMSDEYKLTLRRFN